MRERLNRRWVFAGAGTAILLLATAACTQVGPRVWAQLAGDGGEQALGGALPVMPAATVVIGTTAAVTPTAAAGSAATGPRNVAVRRGPIAEVLPINGHVSSAEETALAFTRAGRVDTIAVQPGQSVQAGDVLVTLEAKDITKDLEAARSHLEVSTIQLQQAQARQRAAEQQAQLDRTRQQDTVAEAEAALRRAQANLDKVKAGPSDSDRQAAQNAAKTAQAAFDRAQADLARLQAGPDPADVRAAQQQVATAQLALQQAEANLARLKAGPSADDIRAAERDVANAQAAFDRAQGDLDRLTKGPDPYDVRAAERDVERAQNAVQAAQAAKAAADAAKVDDATRAARAAALASAQLDLQNAQERLARLRTPATQTDLDAAQHRLDAARADLDTARARLETVRKGPDALTMAAASAAVDNARATLQNATDRLNALQNGPTPEQLTAATNAVEAARGQLNAATARLNELLSHPTPAELSEAQDRLAAARTALERARTAPTPSAADPTLTGDLLLLQKVVAQDQAQVDSLQSDLAGTQLVAPAAGTVVAILVRKGDPVESNQPIIVLAKPGEAIIRADVGRQDAARLVPGQMATIQLASMPDTLNASVLGVTTAPFGGGQVALLSVQWPSASPPFGTAAQVQITIQEKQDALLVPRRAIRSAGTKSYVEYMDGTIRRIASVQVGLVSDDAVEVMSGLSEGQIVVVSP